MSIKEPIRVLLVEDSPSQLQLLRSYLEATPDLVVVGTAINGRDAVQSTLRLHPHVVAMDIHLPVFDGYEATRQIMQQRPTPIVLFSSSTGDAEQRAMAALAAGALAVVRKPSGPVDPASAADRDHLIRTLRLMAGVKVVTRHPPRMTPKQIDQANKEYAILAIAASTGGPAALQTILRDLGSSFPLPIVIAQHVTSGFMRAFADWLASTIPLSVHVVEQETPILPGHVYLPCDDHHLEIVRQHVVTIKRSTPHDRYCPSADHLFSSVAHHYGSRAIGVILTGMGDDGAQGLLELARAGGTTFGQDEASCVVYGMPKMAKVRGAVHHELPLEQLGMAVSAVLGKGGRG
ncbi:MAG TPA: chemotaxis response regulator protein-glutamate methylesterase [Chloroflexus aurantiacus]|jgi:two-component system chemotaxis response regulator CheB|uniref:Protein-glutamate methylesterase/protein-glutamine glutaminase n=1 Tax=Chloroflexus aurantiacus (strain ATCC 29366 / DSM 635 / J-10-fl) TaxID=324602 RepID=A9WGY6_CHLAA|nr:MULTISPECIES: chemotaxis protein CheB [Chloroflexus]ABY34081.1 Protein-glutamate methylesterase [Chloroflexus aurantiacus J-10-fl]GIV93664.1 MAG: chemotaxis response regulator protein-glutamate methylesterase [Chloroflexus sp.]HBW66234.1 chemotaxis response regulator protein-glutamate methylesterase [Chloroflexus aurantiacus]